MLFEVLRVLTLACMRIEALQSNISKVFLNIITYDEVVKHHQRITSMRSSQNVIKKNIFWKFITTYVVLMRSLILGLPGKG